MVSSLLVVEDDPLVLRALVRQLRPRIERVIAVASADMALKVLMTAPFEAVLTDYDLQGSSLDGAQLLSRVADSWPTTRRVLYTGRALPNLPVAHSILRKPASISELIDALSGEG